MWWYIVQEHVLFNLHVVIKIHLFGCHNLVSQRKLLVEQI